MAILPMKRIHIYALLEDRKQILELLQQFGTVQVEDDLQEDEFFLKKDLTDEKLKLDRDITMVSEALAVLNDYAPEEKSMFDSLKGKQELSFADFEELSAKYHEIFKTASNIKNLDRQIAESTAAMYKLQLQIDTISPWGRLDIPLQFQGTNSTAALIGTLPRELSHEDILIQLADLVPEVEGLHLDIISADHQQTCIFVLCSKKQESLVEAALRSIGFARPAVASGDKAPAIQKAEWEEEYENHRKAINESKTAIFSFTDSRGELQFLSDCLSMRMERLETSEHLLESKRIIVISGYILEREAEALTSALYNKFLLYMELSDPSENEDFPILLQNSKFSEPVEGVLKSFSLPGKGEIDPTSIFAFFYYILFGLMFSDAGYGLLMAIVCGICLRKFPKMENNMQKTLRMFFFCGLSTLFWGAVFGSWFGNAVLVISTTFFNNPVSLDPLWFEPTQDPMRMLVFSMGVGVVHLFAGLAANIKQSAKNKQYMAVLYDAGFWYMLIGGLIVLALSSEKFIEILNLNFIIPENIGKTAGIIAAIGAAGIVLTAGRESRNWFKRILKGLYGLYNVSGYLSDILSYSRLLALGLATGAIATVINEMAAMGGTSIGGVILFVIVFIAGHAVNIGINLLGAYVHTNRLTFVEFFGKFYEGGGSEFMPLGINTKYYKIKEELKS
ncbi:MAG TPA: V-type ATP synthase subunit I [Clostridiales bacterium]|nr:V-type ATP synthase subunit I [Clostridiales bacterium]